MSDRRTLEMARARASAALSLARAFDDWSSVHELEHECDLIDEALNELDETEDRLEVSA